MNGDHPPNPLAPSATGAALLVWGAAPGQNARQAQRL
jgi:hypothetical protein